MAPNEKVTAPLSLIVSMLRQTGIIDERFSGQLILHFCDGGIAEIDKLEKNLTKKLKSV
jgi:hypothetical protein